MNHVCYYMRVLHHDVFPVGTIIAGLCDFNEDGWLPCDGREYDPLEYPELFITLVSQHRSFWDRLFSRPGKIVHPFGFYRLPDLRDNTIYLTPFSQPRGMI